MTITLLGIAGIGLMVLLGFLRGALRIAAFIGALLVAGFVAVPVASVVQPLLAGVRFIPRTLTPLVALVAGALVVFLVLATVANWLLRRREKDREARGLPRMSAAERIGGGVLGGLWGLGLVVLIFAGLRLLAGVEAALAGVGVPGAAVEKPVSSNSDDRVPAPAAGIYGGIREQIGASLFAPLVAKANPAEEKIARIFADLSTVTGSPEHLERFQKHPAIARLTGDARIRRVAEDPEIRRMIGERRYFELLDDPKIAALLQEKDLVEQCGQVDLERVLAEVLGRGP